MKLVYQREKRNQLIWTDCAIGIGIGEKLHSSLPFIEWNSSTHKSENSIKRIVNQNPNIFIPENMATSILIRGMATSTVTESTIKHVTVIGGGLMGSGIAQVSFALDTEIKRIKFLRAIVCEYQFH